MLDLDQPRAAFVFAASTQLDLILDYSKRITLSGKDCRRFMLEVIRPAFAGLRWLAAHRFADEPHIADGIAELERQAEQLAEMRLRNPDHKGGPPAQCPACGSSPTASQECEPTSYCSRCLDVIMPGLQRLSSCEEGFGTEAI